MDKRDVNTDILKEIFNISVGKAAGMLSEIVNRKILLNVPDIKILNRCDFEILADVVFPRQMQGTLMVSSISFHDNLVGKANLIFPADKMKSFVQLCIGEEQTKFQDPNFTDVDFDIIKEVGNIILNCIMGESSNFLHMQLKYTLPEVKVYNKINFERDIQSKNYIHILILYISFIIDDTEIDGVVIVDLSLNSLDKLISRINEIEDEFNE